MSSLQALSDFELEIQFVENIIKDYTHLTNSGKTIILCWIPSHLSIVGNERADTAAKSAVSLPITNMNLPAGELFPKVSKFCLNEWQETWDCCEGNKLHSIYPTVGSVAHSKNMSRYNSVLINRHLIGHSQLTHSHFVWWLSTYLSIVCTSCFRETHLGRMCRFAGHSYKIFYSLFGCGAVSKCRQ